MRYEIEGQLLTNIGEAIRNKTGKSALITPENMPSEIESISGGGAVLEPVTITQNGTITPPTGIDGFNSVTVDVPSAGNIEPITITENGTYNPPSGVDGFSPVVVNVQGGSGSGTLPSGYQRVKYIQLDGHAYFNSGLLSTSDFGFEAEYTPASSAVKNLFGGFDLAATDAVFCVCRDNGAASVYPSIGNEVQINSLSSTHEITFLSDTQNARIAYAKYLETLSTTSKQFFPGAIIEIGSFADISGGQISVRDGEFSGKISKLRFFNGNQCVADFIPCKNPQNVVGMYDIVRGAFFSSEGSSQFVAGYDVP